MPPSPRSRRTGADRDAQARAAWLALIDQLTNGQPGARRTWTGDELLVALCAIGDTGQSVVALTGRLYASASAAPRARVQVDVERFGLVNFAMETTPAGDPIVAFPTANRHVWLTPAALTYLPCPASPADGVFVLTVADPVTPPPGQKLPAPAYLQEADGAGSRARWVAGGLVLANHGSAVETSVLTAPEEVWFDFAGLVRWVGRTLGTPPPRTTAEGLDDPAILGTLTEALARHRAAAGAARHGAKATQGDVDAIARAAIAIGLQPTVVMLTRVLGRGSASTLHPLLKSFYRRAVPEGLLPGAEAPPPSSVPPAFLQLLDQLRAAAKAEVDAALAPQRAALSERERAAAAREAAHETAQAELARERSQLTAAAEERDRALARLDAELTAARERIESLTHVERGQAQEIARLGAERDAERDQRLAAVADRVALATRLDKLHSDLTAAAETLSQERLASARAAADDATHVASLTQQLAVATTDAAHRRSATEDLAAQLADTRAILADREHAVADLQKRLQAQSDALELAQRHAGDFAARLAELGEATARKRAELERTQADLAAVTRERDRLDTLVRQLHAAPPGAPSPGKGKRA